MGKKSLKTFRFLIDGNMVWIDNPNYDPSDMRSYPKIILELPARSHFHANCALYNHPKGHSGKHKPVVTVIQLRNTNTSKRSRTARDRSVVYGKYAKQDY